MILYIILSLPLLTARAAARAEVFLSGHLPWLGLVWRHHCNIGILMFLVATLDVRLEISTSLNITCVHNELQVVMQEKNICNLLGTGSMACCVFQMSPSLKP